MALSAEDREHHWCFRRQWILCGKPNCKKKHGPYWYAFRKTKKRTGAMRTVSRYVGKKLPRPEDGGPRDHELVVLANGKRLPAGKFRPPRK